MTELSDLRLFGCLAALAFGVFVVRQVRGHRFLRPSALLGFVSALGLLVVSMFPALVEPISQVVWSSEGASVGAPRILTVMLLVLGAAWLLLLGTVNALSRMKERLDLTIRGLVTDRVLAQPERLADKPILIAIPALNEAANLPLVLGKMPGHIGDTRVQPVVIDDGSTDGTAAVAEAHGAVVARSPMNRGQGAALRIGYDLANACGAPAVVTLDADGQNNPGEIADLVAPILADEADVVIGSRRLGQHDITHWWRDLGVTVFNTLVNLLMGTRVTDISTGYRAMKPSALTGLRLYQDQYQASEFFMMAAKNGLRITERPIHFRRRAHGKSKKGNELLYGLRFFWVVMTTWVRSPR